MAESFPAVPQGFELPRPRGLGITAREWRVHGALFLTTVVTTTLAGMLLVAAPKLTAYEPPLSGPLGILLYIPLAFLHTMIEVIRIGFTTPEVFAKGVAFSASLLAILFSHEMGHYLACRYYKVDATLPYFIPAPPVGLAGTFGAFIKIRSPIPTRRALFDIGLAGPLAGFVVAFPWSVVGGVDDGPAGPAARGSDLFQRSGPVSVDCVAVWSAVGSELADQSVLHGRVDWFAGDEFEFNAGGPTRWWAWNVCALWTTRSSLDSACCFCCYRRSGHPRLHLAQQPERLSLHSSSRRNDARPPPVARRHGTSRRQTHRDRGPNPRRLHPLLLAIPDNDYVKFSGASFCFVLACIRRSDPIAIN